MRKGDPLADSFLAKNMLVSSTPSELSARNNNNNSNKGKGKSDPLPPQHKKRVAKYKSTSPAKTVTSSEPLEASTSYMGEDLVALSRVLPVAMTTVGTCPIAREMR